MEHLTEYEKAQIVLQLIMEKYNCDEEKAKEIIKEMGKGLPFQKSVTVPVFKK